MLTRSLLKKHLCAEAVFLFGLLPPAISYLKPHSWIYLTLWIFSLLCYLSLKKYHAYELRADWNPAGITKATLLDIATRFLMFAPALLFFACIFVPDRVFSLPRFSPGKWFMVLTLYPLLSAIPQEIVYRSFFFHRYERLIPARYMKLASALAFGWIHIILQNWVAVIFSIAGGFLFADTYGKTRSLAASCLEHALYGCYIFTIGLGYYFYHGIAVR